MASIQIVDSLPKDRWMQFIEEHPVGNIFHTPFMQDVFRGTKNYEPFLFATIDKGSKKIESLLVATRVDILCGGLRRFSSRMISYGGIINCGDGNEGLVKLFEFYDRSIKSSTLFTEIRNMHSSQQFKEDMISCGYQYQDYLNYLVDLRRDASTIFRSFSKGRKSDIKSLEKKGFYAKEVIDMKELESVYEILEQTYSRVKIPLADISLFESAMRHLFDKGMVKFFLAKCGDRNAGALVALIFRGVIFTWYYGTDEEFRRLSPVSLLIWHLIKWGAEKRYDHLDFGGAGRPDEEYGVRDFKARFGGQLVNYGRYVKIHRPVVSKLARVGYEVYRRMMCIARGYRK